VKNIAKPLASPFNDRAKRSISPGALLEASTPSAANKQNNSALTATSAIGLLR
jgi:hypothetical protein